MDELMLPRIVDTDTGEELKTNQLTPKRLENILKKMPDKLLSEYLSKINFVKKVADKMEKSIKEIIKTEKTLVFNDGKAEFEDWKLTKVTQRRFNEKRFLEEGKPEEIAMYNAIKEKYTDESEYIKF